MAPDVLLEDNAALFEHYYQRAEAAKARRRDEKAATLLQLAAECAWVRHPGFFHSAKLEGMLREISMQAVSGRSKQRSPHRRSSSRRRVLHVLTAALPFGGHTRTVRNWIHADTESEHHVAMTQQGLIAVPDWLSSAVANSGGEVHLLDRRRGLLRISERLRTTVAEVADLVILHSHPSDVVPTLAFGASSDHPPVGLYNHADHVFWVGAESSDVIVNGRDSGARLTLERRAIPNERTALVPLPLASTPKVRSRELARSALAIDDEIVLILSVASDYKFVPTEYGDYAQIHNRVLERCPNVRFIVVGADPTRPYWRRWADATDGRLKAVGRHADTSDFLAAADIFCDSIPMGSCTSLLEAASVGIPCISWSPYPSGSALLSSDDVAFKGHDVQHSDPDLYVEQLVALVHDSSRAEKGVSLRTAVAQAHTADGWLQSLETLYSALPGQVIQRPHRPTAKPETPQPLDSILAHFRERPDRWAPAIPRATPLALQFQLLDTHSPGMLELAKSAIPSPVARGLANLRSRVARISLHLTGGEVT